MAQTSLAETKFLYKVGEEYPIVCSWTQCAKHFIWKVKKDTNDIRKCCSTLCGLRGKVHHTLKQLKERDNKDYIMDIDTACECIILRANYMGLGEIAKKLNISEELVAYFLTDKLTLERHHSDLTSNTHRRLGLNRVGNRLRGIHRKKYPPISDELRQEIEEKLGLGHSPYRLSKYYDVPRNRIYAIEEGLNGTSAKNANVNVLTKEDIMTIPGAKDMTQEIEELRLEMKTEKACSDWVPDEITLNGKRYREVRD